MSLQVQEFIHRLEGSWALWIRRLLVCVAIAYVASLWLFREAGFRGLAHEKAMDQAQIARELARGHGFATKVIRPAAIWQFEKNNGACPDGPIPDTYHAPLNPLLNAPPLQLVRNSWVMDTQKAVSACDRVLAGVQLGFFLLAVLVSYFTAARLFDRRLAVLGAGLLLMCELFWDYSMAGLPQMLMLFLFSTGLYLFVRVLEARAAGKSTLRWSAALGAVFGLLALAHGITIFIFAAALLCVAILLRPIGRDAGVMLLVCATVVVPWLIRNHIVCGNPLGIAGYALLSDIGSNGSETSIMRRMPMDAVTLSPAGLMAKVTRQTLDQLGNLYSYLGCMLPAAVFFIALLHPFRRREVTLLARGLAVMWLAAVLGMSVAGLEAPGTNMTPVPLRANDLHVLFIPVMTFYGLAFLLVLWDRLEIREGILRTAFVTVIYLISTLPFLAQGFAAGQVAPHPLAAVRPTYHCFSQSLDGQLRDYHVRHALGSSMVCRPEKLLAASHPR